jgi:hypothetical protein
MPMRLEVGLILALALAQPVVAEPAGCPTLTAALEGATGLALTAPPAPDVAGWCVLDGVRSSGDGDVRVSAETLRLRGEAAGDALVALEVEGSGLRIAPALNNRDMPDWQRDLLRLQSAELRLALRRDEAGDRLLVERARLALSGGGELVVTGEIAGADLAVVSLLAGRLTRLQVRWKNDGRTLRPVMEALGAEVQPGTGGTEAVLAARRALLGLVAALPVGSVDEDGRDALTAFIEALPQGRGTLDLDLASETGIGAAQLGLLLLSDDPAGPKALQRALGAARLNIGWTPGIAP